MISDIILKDTGRPIRDRRRYIRKFIFTPTRRLGESNIGAGNRNPQIKRLTVSEKLSKINLKNLLRTVKW